MFEVLFTFDAMISLATLTALAPGINANAVKPKLIPKFLSMSPDKNPERFVSPTA